MAMLSSYTTTILSRAHGESSVAAALQLRKEPAASSSPLVAARRPGALLLSSPSRAIAMRKLSTAAYKYDMLPSALVHPRTPAPGGDWAVTEDQTFITLRLKVGEKTSKDELEVSTTDDQVLLLIKYKKKQQDEKQKDEKKDEKQKDEKQQDEGGDKDDSPESSLPVQLLMPAGCDHNKVKARLFDGWLHVMVAKPKPSEEIQIME